MANEGYSLVVVHGRLVLVGFLVIKPGLLGIWAPVVATHMPSCPVACGILVPGPEIKPIFPELAGRFLTTGPPGKSHNFFFVIQLYFISCLCLAACGILAPQPRIQPRSSVMEAGNLNHWTSREVSAIMFNYKYYNKE